MKKTVSFKNYIHKQLLPLCARLGMLVLLYSIFRLLFFLININSFPNASRAVFFYGIRFDLCAIFFTNAPYILVVLLPFTFYYKKKTILDVYFIIVNTLSAAFSYIDMAYFPYVLKRTTFDIFSYLQIGFDWQTLLPSFLKQFWYLVLLFIATVFILIYMVKITNRKISKNIVFQPFTWKNLGYKSLVFVISIFICLLFMRGGTQTRPLGLIDTGKDASIQHAALISNTPFTLIKSFGIRQNISEKHFFQDLEEAERYFSPVIHSITPCTQYCSPVKNVVVLVLEGFSQYLIRGMEIDTVTSDYQGYAPFLNALAQQSVSFNGIANGHRTIEGLPAIFAGIPNLLNRSYVETSFAQNYSYSPIEMLKNHNYHTFFFHGAKNNSMNIESYCYSIGFEAYYGKNEYPNPDDYDGAWGISDRSYLKYVAQKLSTLPQPFFASVLTLSSHNPYILPKDAEGLNIKHGTHPMHALASYTDHAVKEFFEAVSHQSWYDSTLFIITADHTGEGSIPVSNSRYIHHQIPVIFYYPTAHISKNLGTMQQLDIMPSLFSCLHIDEPLFSYGNNIFDTAYTSYTAIFLGSSYQLISNQYILLFNGDKSTGFFDIKHDILMKNNLLNEMPEEVAFYEQKLKAIIQSYTTRLIRNQLFINNNGHLNLSLVTHLPHF